MYRKKAGIQPWTETPNYMHIFSTLKINQIWQKITGYKLLFFTHALLSIPTFVCIRAFDRWTMKDMREMATIAQKGVTSKTGRICKTNETKPNVLEGIRLLFYNSDAMLFFFLVIPLPSARLPFFSVASPSGKKHASGGVWRKPS